MNKIKVVFFVENAWAFGSIHQSLAKLLFDQGFDCEVLDFFTKYTPEEMKCIDANTDKFVTSLPGAAWLIHDYGINPNKVYGVAHGQWDILLSTRKMNLDINSLGGYGVVSNILAQKSSEFGVVRNPDLIPIGIFVDRFYSNPSSSLNICGYAAAMQSHNFFGEEIKRGHLVQEATNNAGLYLCLPGKMHYLAMPEYYRRVDAVIMSSTEEGAGLPMMEAAAAGRLTIGTPVGYFEENTVSIAHGGIQVPIDPKEFVNKTTAILNYYKDSPREYTLKCEEIQSWSRTYDWNYKIEGMVSRVELWRQFIYGDGICSYLKQL